MELFSHCKRIPLQLDWNCSKTTSLWHSWAGCCGPRNRCVRCVITCRNETHQRGNTPAYESNGRNAVRCESTKQNLLHAMLPLFHPETNCEPVPKNVPCFLCLDRFWLEIYIPTSQTDWAWLDLVQRHLYEISADPASILTLPISFSLSYANWSELKRCDTWHVSVCWCIRYACSVEPVSSVVTHINALKVELGYVFF